MTTDLAVVAGRLTRAADKLEELAEAVHGQWADAGMLVLDEWPPEDAHFIAALDPHTVAALVPLLRHKAKQLRDTYRGPLALSLVPTVDHLNTFAARLLREEENGS